jgi:hypothetical protein
MAMSAADSRPPSPPGRSRWGRRTDPEQPSPEVARIDADTARREAELKAAEALAAQKRAEALRLAAESTAYSVASERDEALQRVAALEEKLNEVLAQDEREVSSERADGTSAPPETVEPTPTPGAAPEAQAEPAPAPEPRSAVEQPELVEFGSSDGHAVLTVLLGVGSLAAAACAVYLAVQDRLVSGPGLVASAATLLLALAVRRTGRSGTQVSIRRGTVTVERHDGVERVDLTSPSTLVEVVGAAGERNRRVLFMRRTKAPLSVDRSMVDVDEFVDALRLWRPDL